MSKNEKDILILENPKNPSKENQKLLIAYKKQLIITNTIQNKISENILSISFPDEILSIHNLQSINKILVCCLSNKTLYLFDSEIIFNNSKISEFKIDNDCFLFLNSKKITSIIDYQETKELYFLLISDKFGEISLKPVSNKETKESFSKEIKIVCGHCDTINYLKLSINKKLLLSSDSFGKIKIYDFPNIFNVLSVLIYHENDILYVNFGGIGDKCIVIINKKNNIDIWSMYDFKLQNKIVMNFIEEDETILIAKMINNNCNIILYTNKNIFLLDVDTSCYKVEKIKEVSLNELKDKYKDKASKLDSTFFNGDEGKIFHVLINEENGELIDVVQWE